MLPFPLFFYLWLLWIFFCSNSHNFFVSTLIYIHSFLTEPHFHLLALTETWHSPKDITPLEPCFFCLPSNIPRELWKQCRHSLASHCQSRWSLSYLYAPPHPLCPFEDHVVARSTAMSCTSFLATPSDKQSVQHLAHKCCQTPCYLRQPSTRDS